MIKNGDYNTISFTRYDVLKTEFGVEEFGSSDPTKRYCARRLKDCLEGNEIVSIQARCRDIDNWYVIAKYDETYYTDVAAVKRVVVHGSCGNKIDRTYLVYEYIDHCGFFWALRADMDKLLAMSKLNAGDMKEGCRSMKCYKIRSAILVPKHVEGFFVANNKEEAIKKAKEATEKTHAAKSIEILAVSEGDAIAFAVTANGVYEGIHCQGSMRVFAQSEKSANEIALEKFKKVGWTDVEIYSTMIVDLAIECPSVDISKESDAVCISTNSVCFGG